MEKHMQRSTEKGLKAWLKKKSIGVTAALVTAFLITGGIPVAQAAGTSDFLDRLAAEKAEIEALLAENQEKLALAEKRAYDLLREGDYYAKPVYPSAQIFFTGSYRDGGRMKNRTREAWAGDIELAREYLASLEKAGVSWYGAGREYAYVSGLVSGSDTGREILVDGNGSIAVGGSHKTVAELGMHITMATPSVEIRTKSLSVTLAKPEIPSINIVISTPAVISAGAPTVAVPSMGSVTAPVVSLNVGAPEAVTPFSVSPVTPTEPANIQVAAPHVSLAVTPPTVTPNLAAPPVAPAQPQALSFNVAPTGPGVFTPPSTPTDIPDPDPPAAPVISVPTPPTITYSVGGFGQDLQVMMNGSQGIGLMNYQSYDTNGGTYEFNEAYAINGLRTVSGTVRARANESSAWQTYSATLYYSPNTFISDVLDHNVDIKGNYIMHVTGGSRFPMFISYNPYLVGETTSDDKTLDFQGTLNMTGSKGIGMEHQLLAGGGGGYLSYSNIVNGRTTTIMKNSGIINLDGTQLIGLVIDTEYFGSAPYNYFHKRPQTINDGLIHILATADNCIGVDYGIYYLTESAGNKGPNNDLYLGNITVDGTSSYGYRQRNYYSTTAGNGTGNLYYDEVQVYGTNGVIRVNGSRNVGVYLGQSMSSGDPASNLHDLQVLVGGSQNIGFTRYSLSTNTNSIVLDSGKLGPVFGFDAGAEESVLIFTNAREIILDKDLTFTAGGSKNAMMVASGTTLLPVVTLATGRTVVSSLPEFYGLVAQAANARVRSTANHHGVMKLSGDESIGMAVNNSGSYGNSDGDILMTGDGATAIYSLGYLSVTGGEITVKGNSDTAIFHNSTQAGTVSDTDIANEGAKSIGIYNYGSGLLTLSGGSISAKGASGAGNLGVGVYNASARTINPSGVVFTADDYAAAVYNRGTMAITGGSIDIVGQKAVGVYQVEGSMTLDSSLDASGSQSTALAFKGGTLSFVPGTSITASGTQSIGVYNTDALTIAPDIALTGDKSVGVYNDATGTLTTTGDITATGTGLTRLAGIYNAGTLTGSTSDITIHQGTSTGIYNGGTVGTIGGTIAVSGVAGGVSIGILNTAGNSIGDVTGTVNAGNHATAIYNAGTMTVSGAVNATGTAQSTGIYNTGAGALTMPGSIVLMVTGADGTGVYNDSTNNISLTGGAIAVSGGSSAGLYHIGSGRFTFGGTAGIVTTGVSSAGIFNDGIAGGEFVMTGGSVTATGSASTGSVGIYNQNTGADFSLSGGTVTALNENSTGVYNEGKFTMSGGAITSVGDSTTGLYNHGVASTLEIAAGNTGSVTTEGVKSSALYNDRGTVSIRDNVAFTAKDGASGLYTAGGSVTANSGAVLTIDLNNMLTTPANGAGEGVGVFASDIGGVGAQVSLHGAEITVVGGSSAVAAYGSGPGTGTTNLDLADALVDYDGAGFAVYSNGQYGKIDLSGAQLNLRGDATGADVDFTSGSPSVVFNGTTIDVYSPGVTLADIKNYATPLYVSSLLTGLSTALGSGITVNDHSGGAYHFARADGGYLHINIDISRSETAGPGADYYRRFHGQRMKVTLDGGKTVTAILDTAGAADYNNQVIGLEGNSSVNALLPAETEIKIESGAKIVAARTDTATDGAVGAYINYGKVRNEGTIEVQRGYAGVKNGVGIFAVNGSIAENAGVVSVSGEKASGILAKSYRLSGGANTVGAEFGIAAADQGKITVENSGVILMNDPAAIGIYAENNSGEGTLPSGTPLRTAAESVVINTGSITTGDGISNTEPAAGMYGSAVTLKNSGTITVGDHAVGIFGENGSVIADAAGGSLGTIKIGGNSVALMGNGSTLAPTITTLTLQSDNTADDKIGIMYTGTAADVKFDIDGAAFKRGVVIYLEDPQRNFAYGPAATMKVGEQGVGVYLSESISPGSSTAVNRGTIELSAGSDRATGLYTDGGIIENAGVLNLRGSLGQTGLFAKGTAAQVKNSGVINFTGNDGAGIFLEDGATLIAAGTMNFGTATQNTGVALDGADALVTGLAITADNAGQNILVFAEDRSGRASTVANGGTVAVDGLTLPVSGSNKTIGIYLKHNATQNKYMGGTIEVQNGATGLYSKGDNLVENAAVIASGKGSVGIYLDGSSTLDNVNVTARGAASGDSVTGVYASGGVVDVVTALGLETGTASGNDYGAGMVLTDGATVTGADITVSNHSTAANVGLYYQGSSGTLAQGTNLIFAGNDLVGIYVDGGMTLTNAKSITYTAGSAKRIGAYAAGGSTYISTSGGDILATPGSAGILAGSGTGINAGTLSVNHAGSAAMAAMAALAGETAKVLNDTGATLDVLAGAGLVVGNKSGYFGTSIGENKGLIQVAAGGTGVVLSGENASFDGSGGVITADGSRATAIYLEETGSNPVSGLGTIALNAPDAIGVYAMSAEISFDLTLDAGTTQGVALLAKGGAAGATTLKNIVDTSASTGTIGVFVADERVNFVNATVKAGEVGIYVDNFANYTLTGVDIEAARPGATGLYTTAGNLNYDVTTRVSGGGLGIYVPAGATLTTTGGQILAADASSTAILLDGGAGNLGVNGAFTLQLAGGAGVIVKNGGVLTTGPGLVLSGPGTFAIVEDADFHNASELTAAGGSAILAGYTSAGPWIMENTTAGIIHVSGGGMGITALKTGGAPMVTIINNGFLDVSGMNGAGQSSVGIYSDVAEIKNNAKIEVGRDAIGIFADNTGKALASHEIRMPGQDSIGIIVSGATAGVVSERITGLTEKGMGIHLDQTTGAVSPGIIDLADSSVGIYIKGGAPVLNGGLITAGNAGLISPMGIYAASGANVSMTTPTEISVGKGGIAVAADGSSVSGVDPVKLQAGAEGVILSASNGGGIVTVGSGTLTASGNIGIYLKNGGNVSGLGAIDVSMGGIGAYVENSSGALPTITVGNGVAETAGSAAKYSIGVYYSNIGGTLSTPTIHQTGDWSIGIGLDAGITATLSNITTGAAGAKHQIGVYAAGTATSPDHVTTGHITVSGQDNIGFYGAYTDVASGDVTTANLPAGTDPDHAAIGLYVTKGGVSAGNITAGDHTTGVYVGNLDPSGLTAANVTAGESAVGIYAVGGGTQTVGVSGDINAGSDNAAGIYGKDVHIRAGGDVNVGGGNAVGIASLGKGDVNLAGDAAVSAGVVGKGGIVLYKKGAAGTITTDAAQWILGDYAAGIYAEQENAAAGDRIVVINHADMRLGQGTVGIYAKGGGVSLENYGVLSAGSTWLGPDGDHEDTGSHRNSAALYLSGGVKAVNYGTLKAEFEHSVAAYAEGGGTSFENAAGGLIEVDNGATGVYAMGDFAQSVGAVATNNGTIVVGNNAGLCGVRNIGMAAFALSTAINGAGGEIHVWNGTGMYAGSDSTIVNYGKIYVHSALGTAVGGAGTFVNSGQMILTAGVGITNGMGDSGSVSEGAVTINEKGIFINEKYITVGGVIEARAPVILLGATVDVAALQTATTALFTAPDISGTVKLTPDFVKTGNGWAFVVEGFTKAFAANGLSKLTVETSPMYIAREVNGELYVAKRPYAELMLPGTATLSRKAQFANLYEGLDSLLYGDPDGITKDALVLKDMNAHLEQVFAEQGTAAFLNETTRVISETRGDIYATVQKRMQDVDSAFERSFEELFHSYNITKDSDKFSVIHHQGKFRDGTTGIDDYAYRVHGLLYMKEHEGRNFGNKWGWSLGFAASRFDFDDAPTYFDKSKEDVYSLRIGWHGVKNLSADDSLRFVTRLGAGYNYHEATRSLELDKTIKNKGQYHSWEISWDGSVEKTLYRNLRSRAEVYAGVKAEYGAFGSFNEKGAGLELAISSGDYTSIAPVIGVKGLHRIHAGKKLSLDLKGDLSAAWELGDNFNANYARLKNSGADRYELIRPEKERGSVGAAFGIGVGHRDKWDVTLDVSARKHTNRESLDVSGGLRFKYVFEPWG